MLQTQDGFDQSETTCSGLKVTDVRLDGTDTNGTRRGGGRRGTLTVLQTRRERERKKTETDKIDKNV